MTKKEWKALTRMMIASADHWRDMYEMELESKKSWRSECVELREELKELRDNMDLTN